MRPLVSATATEPARGRPGLSDLEAVHGVLAGHREMFEVIVRRYNAQLYRVGMAYLRDHGQTEDAMQNAYFKAFLNLGRFRGASGFGTWLTRILINECLMMLRRRKGFTMEALDDGATRGIEESFAAPAPDALLHQDMKAVLEHALQALPLTQRAVYLLREVQHLSTEEAAQCLGLSRENVKVSLHRAKAGLKTQVMKSAAGIELFTYSAFHCDPMTAAVMRGIHGTAGRA